MTESVNVISGRSAQRLRQILARYKGSPAQPPASDLPRGRTPLLVKCTDDTPAGMGVGAECYPAVVVDTDPSQLLADQPTLGDVWLTLMDGSTPTADAYYEGLLAGEFDPDPGGAGTDPRLRVFATSGSGAPAFSGASIINSGTVVISNNTLTNLAWHTAEFDTDTFFSLGDPTKLTVPADGYYHVGADVMWEAQTSVYYVHLALSYSAGATFAYQLNPMPPDAGISYGQMVSGIVQATAGNYFVVTVYQKSGSAQTSQSNVSRFWCYKVG